MPKTLLIFIIVFLSFKALPAQHLLSNCNPDSIKSSRNNYIYSNFQYLNFYNVKKKDGAIRKLYSLRQFLKGSLQLGNYQLDISYHYDRLEGFTNQLDSLTGRLRLQYHNRKISTQISRDFFYGRLHLGASYNDYWGAGIGYKTSDRGFNIEVSPYSGFLFGQVENSQGRVPLAAYAISGRLFYKNTALQYQRIAPLHPDTSYQNDIYGDIFFAETHFQLPWQLKMSSTAAYGNIRAYLNYLHNAYGYLDHFRYFFYSLQFNRTFYENNQISIGNTAFYGWSGKESYLEIWPFNYWSQLLASKTRITRTDVKLNLPFFEYRKDLNYKRKNVFVSGRFRFRWSQLIFGNTFIYKERYFIVYPVLIGYNTYSYSINPKTDGLLLLNGQLETTYKKFKAIWIMSQLLPVDFSRLHKSTDFSGNGDQISGGFRVSVSVYYLLN